MQSDSMVMKFINDTIAEKYLSALNLLEDMSGDLGREDYLLCCCCRPVALKH
jgi:hypothetical protein